MLTIGSLFSGIGGLELGLEWAGLGPVVWQCELDPYGRQVLARHWPHARRHRYVQGLAAAAVADALPRVDLICGGFPCQDVSQANPSGAGIEGERSGLFWWMLDVVDAVRPRVVVAENVGRLARRDLDEVGRQFRARGFEVECTRMLASDAGAPHRRERVFIVAHTHSERREEQWQPEPGHQRRPRRDQPLRRDRASGAQLGHTHGDGPQGQHDRGATPRAAHQPDRAEHRTALEPRVGGAPDGLSARLDAARWPVARGVEQPPDEPPRTVPHFRGRRERIRALGNAVVPHCGYIVGLRVRQLLDSRGAQPRDAR